MVRTPGHDKERSTIGRSERHAQRRKWVEKRENKHEGWKNERTDLFVIYIYERSLHERQRTCGIAKTIDLKPRLLTSVLSARTRLFTEQNARTSLLMVAMSLLILRAKRRLFKDRPLHRRATFSTLSTCFCSSSKPSLGSQGWPVRARNPLITTKHSLRSV